MWDKSQSGNFVGNSLVGTCLTLPNLGFLWVFFKYPKISKNGNPLFFPVTLGLTENSRGPGLWKLNISFLTEEEYINRIKRVILKTCEYYKDDNDVDDALLWEIIKLEVRDSTIFYGEEKAKSRRTDETKHSVKLRSSGEKKWKRRCPPF